MPGYNSATWKLARNSQYQRVGHLIIVMGYQVGDDVIDGRGALQAGVLT